MSDYLDTNAPMSDAEALDATSPDMRGTAPAPNAPGSAVEKPEPDPATKANVEKWTKRITSAKKHYKKTFDRMKSCQRIATEGRDKDWPEDSYTVPVLGRHINVTVAALYARNPTPSAKRRKKVQFKLWDGNYTSLQQAAMAAQPKVDQASGAVMPGDPNAAALLMEVQQVHQQNQMLDRLGQTMEVLCDYFLEEPDTGFKQQLKAAVRRTKVCSVAWVKLGFQRLTETNYDAQARLIDTTAQLAQLDALLAENASGDIDADSAKADELRRLIEQLQAAQETVLREGPVFSFPKATRVIVDPACIHLKTLVGAEWVAEEFPPMSREDILRDFKVDIGANFTSFKADGTKQEDQEQNLALLWEVWDKKTQQSFVVCDGYCDYIRPPAAPNVKLTRFWPLFPLVFNEVEDDDTLFPNSDVWNARHMQREYNTVRQGLREHRIQNKPKYASVKGRLEGEDLKKLAAGASGDIIELAGMQTGEKVGDLLQQIQTVPIDPNLYEVNTVFSDIERVIGSSQADLGAPASTTATQSSIIEQGRATTNSDNVDDLDDMLSSLMRGVGEVMLQELTLETVQKIAGEGAVWPTMPASRQQIADDLWLEVKAGSSGRPNRAAELANMERGLPYLLQIPGINPFPLGRRYGELLDLDVDEIVIEGMPSIQAQNAAAGKGSPQAADGQMQGPHGAMNAPSTAPNEPGAQPSYPAPGQVAPGANAA
jgi:hypothetical protein